MGASARQSPSRSGGCRGPRARAPRGCTAGRRRGPEPGDPQYGQAPHGLSPPLAEPCGVAAVNTSGSAASAMLAPPARCPPVTALPWFWWVPCLPLTQLLPSSAQHWWGECWGNGPGPGRYMGGMKRWVLGPGQAARDRQGAGRARGIPGPRRRALPSWRPPSCWGRSRGERMHCQPGASRTAGEGRAVAAVPSWGAG